MWLSEHAVDRVYDRTTLTEDEVSFVLTIGAFLWLGGKQAKEFLVFYSPLDKKCFVAVVDYDFVITVLEEGYIEALRIWINGKHRKKAKKLLEDFLFKEFCRDTSPAERYLEVYLEIQKNGISQYTTQLGSVPLELSKSLETALPALMPELAPTALAVEEVIKEMGDMHFEEIRYLFRLVYPNAPLAFECAGKFEISHERLIARLKPL